VSTYLNGRVYTPQLVQSVPFWQYVGASPGTPPSDRKDEVHSVTMVSESLSISLHSDRAWEFELQSLVEVASEASMRQ